MAQARIFNIERCATEDGPGLRTTVFLKGCQLRCRWCANPESQSFGKEVLFKSVKCVGCGRCMKACPENAISLIPEYGMITDSNKCIACGSCIDACFADARVMQGDEYTVPELMKILEKDESYYKASGGGITFSGGEPLMYPDFIREASEEIHKRGWNVLVETCGQVPTENIRETADSLDYIYCDFKHYDSVEHKRLTGVGNEQIIENIIWLDEHFQGDLSLRYPYIPGCNDAPEAIEAFLDFVNQRKHVSEVVFLPFHRLGLDKYTGLGRSYEMGDMKSLKVQELNFLKDYQDRCKVHIKIQ